MPWHIYSLSYNIESQTFFFYNFLEYFFYTADKVLQTLLHTFCCSMKNWYNIHPLVNPVANFNIQHNKTIYIFVKVGNRMVLFYLLNLNTNSNISYTPSLYFWTNLEHDIYYVYYFLTNLGPIQLTQSKSKTIITRSLFKTFSVIHTCHRIHHMKQ